MNINIIKEEIRSKLNKRVLVSVYGLRNKIERYEGVLYKVYPNLFTVLVNEDEKSFLL